MCGGKGGGGGEVITLYLQLRNKAMFSFSRKCRKHIKVSRGGGGALHMTV